MIKRVKFMHKLTLCVALPALLIACNTSNDAVAEDDTTAKTFISPVDGPPFVSTEIADFDEPWALAFLDDAGHKGWMLVTEKTGKLVLVNGDGKRIDVAGVPKVDYGGQGGFGDVAVAPKTVKDYPEDGSTLVYLSWIEPGSGDTRGAVVGRARLVIDAAEEGGTGETTARLEGLQTIWKQSPKVEGKGHYSHRLAFSPTGKYLFIGSGERQKFDPAQDMSGNLGKIVRLYPDGSVPEDNPFVEQGGVTAQIWSLGHRNILGLAFDEKGRLWNQEMGPKHGDELNLVKRGANYGYPIVSNGDHYDGREIPDHDTRPEFEAPKVFWVPAISPAGLMFYSGDAFPMWKGNAFIGGLSGKTIVRVQIDGDKAKEVERFDMKARIREVKQGPDGALWVLEDGDRGSNGRLLKLTPNK